MKNFDKLPPYTILTSTYQNNDDFFNDLSFKSPEGELYRIFGGDNMTEDYDDDAMDYFKKHLGIFDNKYFKSDRLLFEDINHIFEFKDIPKFTKERQLYLIVERHYKKHKYTYNYHIGHIMSPREYWNVYNHKLSMWTSFHIDSVVAWYKIDNCFSKIHLKNA